MGIGSYIFAVYQSKFGLNGVGIGGPAPLIVIIIWKIIYAFKNKVRIGVFIDKNNSNILTKEGKYQF